MHTAPDTIQKPDGWHEICYITANDTAYQNIACELLLVGLPHFGTAAGLILAGGNYGCWMGREYPDPDMLNSCHDEFQRGLKLSNCFGCVLMSICMRYPFQPYLALSGSVAINASVPIRP